MSISTENERIGMQQASDVVALTLKKMREYAKPGISTKELDEYGGELLAQFGAHSAPALAYDFPGYTCISVNEEAAHGIPSANKFLKEGDLVNIDVSAELNGYWADNGGSFVLAGVTAVEGVAEVELSSSFASLLAFSVTTLWSSLLGIGNLLSSRHFEQKV